MVAEMGTDRSEGPPRAQDEVAVAPSSLHLAEGRREGKFPDGKRLGPGVLGRAGWLHGISLDHGRDVPFSGDPLLSQGYRAEFGSL